MYKLTPDIIEDFDTKAAKIVEWCDKCHAQFDCEEKHEFIRSEDNYCPYYA